MIDNKQLIAIMEKNGFEVKGKTKEEWKIPYEVKELKERYELSVPNANKKQLKKSLLRHIDYWKVIAMDGTNSLKIQREAEKVINKFKKVIGEINETK